MFPASPSSSSSENSRSSVEISSNRRARCLGRLAGTKIEVYLRDNVSIVGVLSVRGNCAMFPGAWGVHALTAEDLATGMRYSRGITTPEDGWRAQGRKVRKKEEGKFEKLTKVSPQDASFLWLRNAQRRAGANNQQSSPVFPVLAISWRDVYGISGTLLDQAVSAATGKKPKFQTDTQISSLQASGQRSGEKLLERWTDDNSEEARPEDWPSLEEPDKPRDTWNQFEENSRMFGVKTTYDEGLYTTRLNVTEIPEDVQRKAAEIASEMNGGKYKDEDEDEEDEEKKFSAVAGTGAYRKRIPPPPPPPPTTRPPAVAAALLRKQREEHKKELLISKAAVAKRLPKDNINALNLEPIKLVKPVKGGGTVSKLPTLGSKVPNRQKTLEEFSQIAQAIQEKMEKKGWTSPPLVTNPPAEPAPPPAAAEPVPQPVAKPVPQPSAPPRAPGPEATVSGSTAPNSSAAPAQAPSPSAGRREDSFKFNPNANSFTPKGEPGDKPESTTATDTLSSTMAEITHAIVHSPNTTFALPTWSPRFQISYIDCLAASPAAYTPYHYAEYAPPPPLVMINDAAAQPAFYYQSY